MSEASLTIQAKVLEVVAAAITPTPVYDHVPQDLDPLYVQIGEDTAAPDNTKSANGQEHLVEINIYSRGRGYKEVKQTAQKIYDALHRKTIFPNGTQRVIPQWEFATYFRDPDGPRGVLRFRFQT